MKLNFNLIVFWGIFTLLFFFSTSAKTQQGDLKNAEIHKQSGLTYFSKGQYELAIEEFSRAIEINHKYAVVFLERGKAFSKKGDFDRAIGDCDKAIELNPKYSDAYYTRALAWADKVYTGCFLNYWTRLVEVRWHFSTALA